MTSWQKELTGEIRSRSRLPNLQVTRYGTPHPSGRCLFAQTSRTPCSTTSTNHSNRPGTTEFGSNRSASATRSRTGPAPSRAVAETEVAFVYLDRPRRVRSQEARAGASVAGVRPRLRGGSGQATLSGPRLGEPLPSGSKCVRPADTHRRRRIRD